MHPSFSRLKRAACGCCRMLKPQHAALGFRFWLLPDCQNGSLSGMELDKLAAESCKVNGNCHFLMLT